MDKRIDDLAAQMASRVMGPNALQRYIIWGTQVGVEGLQQELENLEFKQCQLYEDLVKIYDRTGNRLQAEHDARALIEEYQQLHLDSRGGIQADFADAGEPLPTAPKSQPDMNRLIQPLVQDAVVYVKPGYTRAVVIDANNTAKEAILQIQG